MDNTATASEEADPADVPGIAVEAFAADDPVSGWSLAALADRGELIELGRLVERHDNAVRPHYGRLSVDRLVEGLRARGKHEVLSSRLIWQPVRTIVASSSVGVKVLAKTSTSESKSAGLSLTVSGLGLTAKRTYQVERELAVVVEAGAAALDLLVPLFETIKLVVPPGGSEPFPMRFYEHYGRAGATTLGSRSTPLKPEDVEVLLSRSEPRIPIGGAVAYDDTFSRTAVSEFEVSLTPESGGITPEVTGSVKTSSTTELQLTLPPGDFDLRWFGGPLGGHVSKR